MATTTIPWDDGSGDNIYFTYPSASGDQTVEVSSDANTGSARSKVVTFTAGSATQTLTVNQDAGVVPGSLISDYVQNGLILHLDGKEKGGGSTWDSVIGTAKYTNYNAVFNSDHVYFNGTNSYLRGATPASNNTPTRTTGTIEIVYENENFGTSASHIFVPRTNNRIGAYIAASGSFWYAYDNTNARSYYGRVSTLAKASISVNSARGYENGIAINETTSKSYVSGVNSSYNYIGRRQSTTTGMFKGKIYSIRIYNRQLTETEVMQNLSVDNLRFNLGLTL
jgi:hypothetical protein